MRCTSDVCLVCHPEAARILGARNFPVCADCASRLREFTQRLSLTAFDKTVRAGKIGFACRALGLNPRHFIKWFRRRHARGRERRAEWDGREPSDEELNPVVMVPPICEWSRCHEIATEDGRCPRHVFGLA